MSSGKISYERTDAHPKVLIWSLTILALFIAVSFWGMKALYENMTAKREAQTAAGFNPFGARPQLPPAPRLQASPAVDKAALLRDEESLLHAYAWVDRDNGIVRIPVDLALETAAQQGLPAWASPAISPDNGAQGEGQQQEPGSP